MRRVPLEPTFAAFRDAARPLLLAGVPPDDVLWEDTRAGQAVLFDAPAPDAPDTPATPPSTTLRLSRRALDLAETASFHSDGGRFALLYRVLYRLTHGAPGLLDLASDPDVARLRALVQAVRRDEHKMHAFVRFRKVDVPGEGEPWFVAWYAPDHPILRLTSPFFERRFASMRWSILTPTESAHWDGKEARFGPGARREDAPPEDAFEAMFRTYYRAIFNPARVNLEAMRAEMPKKFWSDLPETRVLRELVRDSQVRVEAMRRGPASAADAYVPKERSLPTLARAVGSCRACPLWEPATQAVFGEPHATDATGVSVRPRIMLVGEQPGDAEDLEGRPFVGPAGRLLDASLALAGLDRATAYVTNAVKHFKFEPRGKRRLHQRPTYEEVRACRGWLDAEIEAVRPEVIVCLGSTAAQSFFGKRYQVSKGRGGVVRGVRWARAMVTTWHPAAILRAPDPETQARMQRELTEDLRVAVAALGEGDGDDSGR